MTGPFPPCPHIHLHLCLFRPCTLHNLPRVNYTVIHILCPIFLGLFQRLQNGCNLGNDDVTEDKDTDKVKDIHQGEISRPDSDSSDAAISSSPSIIDRTDDVTVCNSTAVLTGRRGDEDEDEEKGGATQGDELPAHVILVFAVNLM